RPAPGRTGFAAAPGTAGRRTPSCRRSKNDASEKESEDAGFTDPASRGTDHLRLLTGPCLSSTPIERVVQVSAANRPSNRKGRWPVETPTQMATVWLSTLRTTRRHSCHSSRAHTRLALCGPARFRGSAFLIHAADDEARRARSPEGKGLHHEPLCEF